MIKQWKLVGSAVLIVLFSLSTVCVAITVLTEEQALKEVFFSGAEIETETQKLTKEKRKQIEERLGGSLVYHQEGSESTDVESQRASRRMGGTRPGLPPHP